MLVELFILHKCQPFKKHTQKKKKKTLVALLQKYIFFAHIELMGILE